MSYSIYVFLMLIFFILAPFYLLLRIVDYTGYVFIGAIRKGKKEWNWFPEMNWKLYSLLFSAAIISMFIGAIPIKYVNWDSLPGYSAYPLFYILIALILLLVYLFEISSPYSVADSIRAKLDHKNLLKVEKNNSLALMENEKDQPTIVFENFTIKNNNLNYNPSYKNCFQNITKEGDTFNQTTTNAYYDKKPRIKRLPFEKQKDLSRSFEKLFEKAKKMGLREESRISFRIMIEDGYCPEEPLYFNNSRTMKGGVREVNKAAVLDFYLCFFKFTSDNNKKWAYGLEYLRQFISNNSKFHPDNIKPNESINEEILIGDATFSRAKSKLCKNSKP